MSLHARSFRHGSSIAAAALAATAAAIAVAVPILPFTPARAHDVTPALPAPTAITADPGDRPGAVIVSWTAAAGAAAYHVGWIAHADYPNHFQYAQVPAGQTAYTVTGLTPGADYWFIVASSHEPDGALQWAQSWAG